MFPLTLSRTPTLVAAVLLLHRSIESVVEATDEECIAAFSNVTSRVCDSFGLTLEQLLNDPCPEECQAALDQVSTSCVVGEDEYLELAGFKYREEDLFSSKGGDNWASCDYAGYTPTSCEQAYAYAENFLPCNAYFPTPTSEQLQTEPCPTECQERYNYVLATCQPGDVYLRGFGVGFRYGESLLYHEQSNFKRAQCDVGFEADPCTIAVDALTFSVFDFHETLGPINGTLPVCVYEENQEACSPGCMALIDAVITDCSGPDAVFSPSDLYSGSDFQIVPFEGQASLERLSLSPEDSLLTFGALSELCWDYYVTNAPDDGGDTTVAPTMTTASPDNDPSPPTDESPTTAPVPAQTNMPIASAAEDQLVGVAWLVTMIITTNTIYFIRF